MNATHGSLKQVFQYVENFMQILNFFETRGTNASALSFIVNLKLFRDNLGYISDKS